MNLYTSTRNSLVHNYSLDGKFDIDHRGNENVPYAEKNGLTYINTKVFTKYVEKGFEDVSKEFRVVGSKAYENALNAYLASSRRSRLYFIINKRKPSIGLQSLVEG